MHENTALTVRFPHLNNGVPVGDWFSGTCEHFAPVGSTEVVCIVANTTNPNDLIMANTVGAGGKNGKDRKNMRSRVTMCFKKTNDIYDL